MKKLKVDNVSFAYDDGDRLILRNINMDIREGEFVCLLGQSGCGKSTFLRLLAGLELPTTGKIFVDGQSVAEPSLDRGVVFQDYGLFPWMSAGENILLALQQRYPHRDGKELKRVVLDMLQAVGLDESIYGMFPKALSGGMKQRCAIARAFAIDPPVLLMDEPFGALDAVTRAKLQNLVLELWSRQESKKTVFFVTHDVDEALLLASRIFVFGQSPSQIIYECLIPEELRPTHETQFEEPEVLKLRHTLIREINKDVSAHIS